MTHGEREKRASEIVVAPARSREVKTRSRDVATARERARHWTPRAREPCPSEWSVQEICSDSYGARDTRYTSGSSQVGIHSPVDIEGSQSHRSFVQGSASIEYRKINWI